MILTCQRHLFFALEDKQADTELNVDQFKDSYARDVSVEELKDVRSRPLPIDRHQTY